ncbi:MAG: MotA/TolQ/ExbB proton channel family protein [Phycisphaerae bacterium]
MDFSLLLAQDAGEKFSWFHILVWPGGGSIGILLWLMSFATLGLIIFEFIMIRRENVLPEMSRQQIQQLFEQKQYREAIDYTGDNPDFLSYVVHAALTEAPHGYTAMERAMEEAGEERTTQLLRKIEWLNLIGNIAPMFGLLGTVWGMINAFFDIAAAGSTPKPADLAESIGIALVTTMLGLVVAIPSLAIYSVLRSRIDALTSEAMMASQNLVATFRPGKKG